MINTFTSIYKSTFTILILFISSTIFAQTRQDVQEDSTSLNMDAVYQRPFLTFDKAPVAVGGYLEGNALYNITEGVSEGLNFQARRLTLFFSSSIGKNLKFLSEIEFEDGTKEIAIEFAALDVSINPALNLRGGIILNPIGSFNQNHDGPKWEFVERPDVSTNLLPATWSNAGFGIYGKTYKNQWTFGYEAYLSNGFDESIINNEDNRTLLAATKNNPNRFEENNSGKALITAKFAIKKRGIGEIGLSYMGGVYNKSQEDGLVIANSKRLDVFAIDINTTIKKTGTYLVGEAVLALIQVPNNFTQQYGNKQQGFFIDVVQPILKTKILNWDNAIVNISARTDYADFNTGTFNENNQNIGDDVWAITPAISLRPSVQTVFRINYRYQWQTDIINNPALRSATWLLGFSTYF